MSYFAQCHPRSTKQGRSQEKVSQEMKCEVNPYENGLSVFR